MDWLGDARYDQAESLHMKPFKFPSNHSQSGKDWDWTGTKACCYVCRNPQVKMTFHWTGVKKLIRPEKTEDQVRIIQALFYCGMDSECFNTVVSKCILDVAWQKVKWNHRLCLALDGAFLACLAANSAYMIYGRWAPPWYA